MDYVNKYENRTVWGQGREVSSTFGATKVLLRARPAGESGFPGSRLYVCIRSEVGTQLEISVRVESHTTTSFRCSAGKAKITWLDGTLSLADAR